MGFQMSREMECRDGDDACMVRVFFLSLHLLDFANDTPRGCS
jgi:hypothetical protein